MERRTLERFAIAAAVLAGAAVLRAQVATPTFRTGTTLIEVNFVAFDSKGQPVRGAILAAFQSVDLAFAIHTRETFEARLQETNVFRVRHAKAMLATYDQGRPIRRYSYPVQAIAFGKDLTLVALGGEVVVDYALRIKKEYGSK